MIARQRCILFLLASLLPLTAAAAAAEARTWKKVLLPTETGAVCLDGSPGGGYFSPGTAPGANKWLVFHQGGGWCGSHENCWQRSLTALGSSKGWGPTYTDRYEGSRLFETPPFDAFNVFYAMYCDGGSWTGDAEGSFTNATTGATHTVQYRGQRLLDALLTHLLDVQGMAGADEVLYAGCSAGALTAYLHLDYVAARLPPTVRKVRGLADAMFSLQHDDVRGQPTYQDHMRWGYGAWNSSGGGAGVDATCLAHYGVGEGWRCMFGANVAPFVETPLFVLNSKYDTWQKEAILGLDCAVTQCRNASDEAFWVEYGRSMVSALDTTLPPRHGAFLSNCPAHCQTGIEAWDDERVGGSTMGSSFVQWYGGGTGTGDGTGTGTGGGTSGGVGGGVLATGGAGGSGGGRWVERCDERPCGNDTCGGGHGRSDSGSSKRPDDMQLGAVWL